MKRGDPFSVVRRIIVERLREGFAPHGFCQFNRTVYFVRDRGPLRDAVFFQKMRSDSICFAYGESLVPSEGEWVPAIRPSRWLNDQEFFNCRYVEHAERSIARALDRFAVEALPWFAQFQSVEDITNQR